MKLRYFIFICFILVFSLCSCVSSSDAFDFDSLDSDEITYVVKQDADDSATTDLLETNKEMITDEHGIITESNNVVPLPLSTTNNDDVSVNTIDNGTQETTAVTSTYDTTFSYDENKNDQIVYITESGEKFHLDFCQYLKKSKIQTTYSQAISQGYQPCSRCFK